MGTGTRGQETWGLGDAKDVRGGDEGKGGRGDAETLGRGDVTTWRRVDMEMWNLTWDAGTCQDRTFKKIRNKLR